MATAGTWDNVCMVLRLLSDGCIPGVAGASLLFDAGSADFRDCEEQENILCVSFASGADESFLSSTNQPINYYFHTMPNGIPIDKNGFAYGYRDLMDFTGKDVYGFGIFGYFGNDEKITIADKYTYNGTEYPVGVIFQHLLLDNTTVKSVTIKCSFLVASEAFMNAYALEEVILPSSGCEQIGMKAFAECTSLKKVTIGSGFQIIFKSAFEGCTSLAEVKCNTDLKAWTSDVSLVQSFEANENLNNALLGNCKDCWFFAAEYNSAVVEATIKSFGY